MNVANLIINQGIAKHRVVGGGEGEYSPIANNDIEEFRAKNRRVELYVYSIGEDLSALMENITKVSQ